MIAGKPAALDIEITAQGTGQIVVCSSASETVVAGSMQLSLCVAHGLQAWGFRGLAG